MPEYKNIHYIESGKENQSTLVFLHGFLGNIKDWKKVSSSLNQSYHCIYIDLPGHGKSQFIEEKKSCPFSEFSDWLMSFLNEKVKKKVNVIGYSMGSRLIIEFLSRYSDSVESVILESTSMTPYSKKSRLVRRFADEGIVKKIKKVGIRKFLEGWYDLEIFKGLKSREDFSELMQERLKNKEEKIEKVLSLYSVSNQKSPFERLKKNNIKMMSLYGSLDEKAKKNSFFLKEYISSLKIEQCTNVSHNIHWENPEEFILKVKNFIK